jgi:hypothetical protein
MNHTLNRDKVVVVPGHHATSVKKGPGARSVRQTEWPVYGWSRWSGPVKRACSFSTPSWSVCKVGGPRKEAGFERPWAERELVLVESYGAELVVRRRWQVFHRDRLGFTPSWGTPMATEVSCAGAPRFV